MMKKFDTAFSAGNVMVKTPANEKGIILIKVLRKTIRRCEKNSGRVTGHFHIPATGCNQEG